MGLTFKPELAAKVMAGEKTQTRRLVKPNEGGAIRRHLTDFVEVFTAKDSVAYNEGRIRTKWQVGRTYAVQPGRGKSGIGYIEITDIRREDVRNISQDDALSEGFETPLYFLQTWSALNPSAGVRLVMMSNSHWLMTYKRPHDVEFDLSWIKMTSANDDEVLTALGQLPAEAWQAWVLDFRVVQ